MLSHAPLWNGFYMMATWGKRDKQMMGSLWDPFGCLISTKPGSTSSDIKKKTRLQKKMWMVTTNNWEGQNRSLQCNVTDPVFCQVTNPTPRRNTPSWRKRFETRWRSATWWGDVVNGDQRWCANRSWWISKTEVKMWFHDIYVRDPVNGHSTEIFCYEVYVFFPQTGLPVGFSLRKK